MKAPGYLAGRIRSRDGSQDAALPEALQVIQTHVVRLGVGQDGQCASGTLVRINGHLLVATARHVVDALYRDDGKILLGGPDLSNPFPSGPDLTGHVHTTGGWFELLKVFYPTPVGNEFLGASLSHPDVALLKLNHNIPVSRFASCQGGVLMGPHNDLICFAGGFPADYSQMGVCVHGDDFQSSTHLGVTIYSMSGLARGTLVRASGESEASHQSFGGMSGGGLFVRIQGGWHYAGTVFLEERKEGVGDVLYAVAAAEIVSLVK